MSSDLSLSVADISKGFDLPLTPLDRVLGGFSFGTLGRKLRHEVLRGVSFDVRKGETIALLGINGAGKSTLLQIVAGTMAPTGGHVEVRGRVAALLELGAGFSPDFTGRENALLNARLLGIDEAHAKSLIPWIVDFSGIGEAIDRPVRFYSSGMFVRLAFAVAAAVKPDIMIIDEALGVGDAVFQAKCYRYLKEDLSEVTKILVSHDSALVGALADRAIVLGEGRVVYDGLLQGGLDTYERASNAATDRKAGGSHADASGLAVTDLRTSAPGRAGTQAMPGDALSVEAVIRSNYAAPLRVFANLKVSDAFGQCVISNDQVDRRGGILTLVPGDNRVSLELDWPPLRRGQYVLDLGLDLIPTPSSHGTPSGAFRQVTVDCMARHGAPAILTVPVRLRREDGISDVAV